MKANSTKGSLLVALAFCCLPGVVAHAQELPATPPVKMGLWESTVTSTIGGLTIPPDVAARLQAMGRSVPGSGPHTVVTQSCMTKDEWAKSIEKMNNNESKCTYTNRSITSQKFSFDMSCASEHGGVFTGHFEMLVDDDEHTHGTAHMKSETSGPNGQTMTIDTTLSAHYLAADCGDVKPGDAKVVKNE
jgi:hypothetical protein